MVISTKRLYLESVLAVFIFNFFESLKEAIVITIRCICVVLFPYE